MRTASDRRPLQREQVWEMVEVDIRSGGAYAPSFYVLLTIAGVIGAVGILTKSRILVVAAVAAGPEYNAIISVALAIGQRDRARCATGCSR